MAKLIDETGNKYGYLTVLGPEKIKNRTHWRCKCACGKEITVLGGTLRNGNTKSCGCMKSKEILDARRKYFTDMIGKTYGKLLVLELDDDAHYRDRHVKCKCLACGAIKSVRAADLKNNKIISCGCINSKGNYYIKNFLIQHNINFKSEYKIPQCKDKQSLPFDFAIFDKEYNLILLIEYQGKQHYSYKNAGWDDKENFLKIQKHDNIKLNYCLTNNIKLVRISYEENLQQRMEEILNEL